MKCEECGGTEDSHRSQCSKWDAVKAEADYVEYMRKYHAWLKRQQPQPGVEK